MTWNKEMIANSFCDNVFRIADVVDHASKLSITRLGYKAVTALLGQRRMSEIATWIKRFLVPKWLTQ